MFQYMGENFVSTVEPDLSIFEPSELKVLAEVKEYFKDFNATQIREFSHDEQGYQKTSDYEPISYSYAESLNV